MIRISLGTLMAKITGAAIISMAGVCSVAPITAQAQSKEVQCVCESKCTEESIDSKCEVCAYDYNFCEGDKKQATTEVTEETKRDETENTASKEKKVEKYDPLTPDGNLTLVDDYGTSTDAGKQFITVVTKSGNYFYIIIDRDDNGTETVHFLNMVDESDLMALMNDDEVEEYKEQNGMSEKKEDTTTESEDGEDEEKKDISDQKPDVKGQLNKNLFILLAVGGIAAVYFITKKSKNKKPVDDGPDPDIDYSEDADYLASIPTEEEEKTDYSNEVENALDENTEE